MVSEPSTTGALPDARPRNWVDRFAPAWLRPYARLARWDRPIGWWLLLFPCWWSLAAASSATLDTWPSLRLLALFLIGAIAMRGAGCTWNDILDRDIDAAVARTRARPIPAGEVSLVRATIFLAAQALVGLAVLLQFNRFTQVLGLAALVPVAVYPLMKRITYWPQLFLGIAFSWGALVGWSAVTGGLAEPAYWLFAGCIFWTIGYDTIYALQDREDDALIGVRSTALLFGAWAKAAVVVFYALALTCWLAAFVEAAPLGVFAVLVAGAQMAWQVLALRENDPASCLRAFKSNQWIGWLVFAGLALDGLLSGLPTPTD